MEICPTYADAHQPTTLHKKAPSEVPVRPE